MIKKKVIEALTGVHTRTSTLSDAGISSVDNHRFGGVQAFAAKDPFLRPPNSEAVDNAARKCVYNYEDKYTFARILVSDSLIFDSHFESGNLHSAFRVIPSSSAHGSGATAALSLSNTSVKATENLHTYDLYMHNDCFTMGHTQWFYFSVKNVTVGQVVVFNIRNFSKPDSLFNEGMKPLIYSSKSKRGWTRTGANIQYYYSANNNNNTNVNVNPAEKMDEDSKPPGPSGGKRSSTPVREGPSEKGDKKDTPSAKQPKPGSYVLTFTHTFGYKEDLCYFAYCLPYTYTDLQRYLLKIDNNSSRSKYVRRTELCRTLAGNVCDLLTITAPSESPEELNARVGVVLTARVHPGESNASWIMQGILDYITGDSPGAVALRQQYVFKIVPMLNPDGVINGNYRCSLAGVDLNRRWSNPDPLQHPTVFHTKILILKIKKIRQIGLIIDIHGHSLKQGAFFYGCSPDKKLLRARPLSPTLTAAERINKTVEWNEKMRDIEGKESLETGHINCNTKNQDHIAYNSLPFDNVAFLGSISDDQNPDSQCVTVLGTPSVSPPRTAAAAADSRGVQLPDSRYTYMCICRCIYPFIPN
jgi:hypothetical protein